MDLVLLGWTRYVTHLPDSTPVDREGSGVIGRVTADQYKRFTVVTAEGEFSGIARTESGERPVIGDWVTIVPSLHSSIGAITSILPRYNLLTRKTSGRDQQAQHMAANVDRAFIVTSADHDHSVRRLERYLTLIHESRVEPVILLSKTDTCDDVDSLLSLSGEVAHDVPVIPLSVVDGTGVDSVLERIGPGDTIVLLGSSGVGKSTLINHLLGEDIQDTGAVREDDSKGRHVTSSRELFVLPGGGILIDNPGIRELGLLPSETGLDMTFSEISEMASSCKFKDCGHRNEPGCAVLASIKDGSISQERYDSYQRLVEEQGSLEIRSDPVARKKKDKQFGKMVKSVKADIRERKGR